MNFSSFVILFALAKTIPKHYSHFATSTCLLYVRIDTYDIRRSYCKVKDFVTPILRLVLTQAETQPQAVAVVRRETLTCNRIEVARVFASTSACEFVHTHALTLQSQASRRGRRIMCYVQGHVRRELWRYCVTDLYSCTLCFFRPPQWIVQFTVPIRPWIDSPVASYTTYIRENSFC